MDAMEEIESLKNQLSSTASLKEALEMDMKKVLKDMDNEKNLNNERKKRIEILEEKVSAFEFIKSQLEDETRAKNEALRNIIKLEGELDSEKAVKDSINSAAV